jgi:hypothetical protein
MKKARCFGVEAFVRFLGGSNLMSKPSVGALLFLGALAISSPAQASIISFQATLTNSAETPPTVPTNGPGAGGGPRTSFGFATFVLDTSVPMMTMTATITGIDINGTQTPGITNDDLVAAHIHAGPADPNVTTNPVRWGFFGTPDNDVPPTDQLVITPAASGAGGTFTSIWDAAEGNPTGVNDLAGQIPFILDGKAYINFHTTQFSGGEIRGTLVAVPAPSTLVLTVLGMIGAAGLALRRRVA